MAPKPPKTPGHGHGGIPQDQLDELIALNAKCGKIITILKGDPLPDDPDPTLLQQILAAINGTNTLIQQLIDMQTAPEEAADLGLSGGTIVPK